MTNRLSLLLVIVAAICTVHGQNPASKACHLLQIQLPGLVHFPGECFLCAVYDYTDAFHTGSTQYLDDISHWTLSSNQNSTCSVEPSSIEDVSTIVSALPFTAIQN